VTGVEWPVELAGVTETVVTTLGPNERWNAAALGVRAGDPATATTWGRTRTRRNFTERGEGYVHLLDDPELFVAAALGVEEREAPTLPAAAAWVRVAVERSDSGTDGGTEWVEWTLEPVEAVVRERTVPRINRGFGAVVEATVAASRLDVDAYDRPTLVERLAHLGSVVERCGGPAERRAFDRLVALSAWDGPE